MLRVLAVFLAFTVFAVLSWLSFGSWEGRRSSTRPPGNRCRHDAQPSFAVALVCCGGHRGRGSGRLVLRKPVVGVGRLRGGQCGGTDDRGVAGAGLVRRASRPAQAPELAGFIAGACVIAPLFGAGDRRNHHLDVLRIDVASGVLTWWAGGGLGILAMATPILLWNIQSLRCAVVPGR